MNTKFYRDLKHSYVFKVENRVTKCQAKTIFMINDSTTYLSANGSAKCSPEDKFDKNFGCELAKARAKQKLARKIEKLLKNYSNTRTDNKKKTPENYMPKHLFYYTACIPAKTVILTSRGIEAIITALTKSYIGSSK